MRDAPMMAKRLLEKKVFIDGFISSTANRALTTAKHFAEAYHFPQNKIEKVQQLYHAYPQDFYQVISKWEDNINSAAIFSHNPGITEFVNSLTDTTIDNMPTCGIFAIKADIKYWKDFNSGKRTLWFFDYPKI